MGYFAPDLWKDNGKLAAGVRRALDKAKGDPMRTLRDKKVRAAYFAFYCQHNMDSFNKAVTAAQREYFLESSMYHPLILTQVLTAVPALVEALDPNKPPFKLQPDVDKVRAPAQADPRYAETELMGDFINSQLYMDLGWRELLGPLAQEAKLTGTAFTRLEWYRRAEPQWGVNEYDDGAGGKRYEFGEMASPQVTGLAGRPRIEYSADRPRQVLVPHAALFLDPRGRSFRRKHDPQPVRYAIEQWSISIEELLAEIIAAPGKGWQYPTEGELRWLGGQAAAAQAALEGKGAPLSADEQALFERGIREWLGTYKGICADDVDDLRKMQAEARGLMAGSARVDEEDDQLLRVLSMWTCGPDPWHILTLGNSATQIVLRKLRGKDHPCILFPMPYIAWTPIPVAHELYGLGLIDILEKIQEEINTVDNLGLTSLREGICGITVVDRSSGVTRDGLLSQPNRVVEVANSMGLPLANYIHYIERPMPNLGALFARVGDINEEGNRAGGATEYLQGASPELGGGTVRGYAMAVQQGGRRWGEEARNLALCAVEMGEGLQALDIQYIHEAAFFQPVGVPATPENVQGISLDIIGRKYRFFFNADPVVVNEQVRQQAFTTMSSLYGAVPEFNRAHQIYEHARALHLPEPEKYVLTPQPTGPQEPGAEPEGAPVAAQEPAGGEPAPAEGGPQSRNVAVSEYPPLPPEVPVE